MRRGTMDMYITKKEKPGGSGLGCGGGGDFDSFIFRYRLVTPRDEGSCKGLA